jgi:hypothetical protein
MILTLAISATKFSANFALTTGKKAKVNFAQAAINNFKK